MRTLTQFSGSKKPRKGEDLRKLTHLQQMELLKVCNNVAKRVCARYLPDHIDEAAGVAMIRALSAVQNGCAPATIVWAAQRGALEHYRSVVGRIGKKYGHLLPLNKPESLELTFDNGSIVERRESGTIDKSYATIDDNDSFQARLKTIPPREALVIDLYYREQKTMAEIGATFDPPVNEARIFQIHRQAIKHLREDTFGTKRPAHTTALAKSQPLYTCPVCRRSLTTAHYTFRKNAKGVTVRHSYCRVCRAYTQTRVNGEDLRVNRIEFLRDCWELARQFKTVDQEMACKKRTDPFAQTPQVTGRRRGKVVKDRCKQIVLSRFHPARNNPIIREIVLLAVGDFGLFSLPKELIHWVLDDYPSCKEIADRFNLNTAQAQQARRRIILCALGIHNPTYTLRTMRQNNPVWRERRKKWIQCSQRGRERRDAKRAGEASKVRP